MTEKETMIREKKSIALTSVLAAVFLTSFKLVVGLTTGSLGILSEALHSALDLIAAIITMFAVRVADRPPDEDHNYGHGKVENYSALIETFLLVITCGWIIYEAFKRLVTHEVHIEVTVWSFIVILTSIVVDFSRSRALMRVAKKYNSQALEADALHFSTDIWSSFVVLFGLGGAVFGFYYADTFSALIVAVIVLSVSYRLGKRSVNALMDKEPEGVREEVLEILGSMNAVKSFHDLKIRESGPYKFIALNIHVDDKLSIREAHVVSDEVESVITQAIQNSTVMVHLEPDNHC